MKALIVDNQPEIREGLILMLQTYCPQITELREADGVASGVKAVHEFKPDLVFTDVEMDDGTGMDFLSRLPEINFQVIFITAYNKYAVDAFRFAAIDFLLKPIEPDLLITAVQRAVESSRKQKMIDQLSVLNGKMKSGNDEKRIVLKDQKAIYVVKVSEVVFLQADGVYTHFNLINGDKIMVSHNIKEYDEALTPYGFMRVHNSYLVNLALIRKFDKADGGSLIMEGNSAVPVSTRKREVILDYLKNI